jgi:integrase
MLESITSPTERWHLFGSLRRFLGWARRQNLIESNPADDFDRHYRPVAPRSRDHVPSLAVLRAAWGAVEQEPPHTRDLIRFLLLVPLRRSEAASMKWSDVDVAGKRIAIPADRMKGRERHELPLAPAALAILEARQQPEGLVFSTAAGKLYNDWDGVIGRIRRAIGQASAGKEQRFTLHDIRRGFVSHLAGQFDLDLLDQCLSHKRKGVFGIYQRASRWPERVAALNRWAGLVAGAEESADNVLSFRSAL